MKEMLRLLSKKLTCSHTWSTYFEMSTTNGKGEVVGVKHTLICKTCGKIKKIKL